MAAGLADGFDEELAQLERELFQLRRREVVDLLGGGDGVEQRVGAHALRSAK